MPAFMLFNYSVLVLAILLGKTLLSGLAYRVKRLDLRKGVVQN